MTPSLPNADRVAPTTVLVAANAAAPMSQPPLAALHGRTIALHVRLPGRRQVLIGRATYERDPQLGAVLRIEPPASAACEFILVERDFKGSIASGEANGCDYSIHLG